jgi:CBS-domain-containing membrane protein
VTLPGLSPLTRYLSKMTGGGSAPPGVSAAEVGWSWLGGAIGIGLIAWLNRDLVSHTDLLLMIGSFGASAVLVYGAVRSPLAQPRNLVGGHVVSALVGVTCRDLLHPIPWLAASVAVATAIAAMHITRTVHPPGGATALIAVTAGPRIVKLGYLYAAIPVGAGALILLAVAVLVNNLSAKRRYPEYWW